jgi:sulfoxide reductase heme-binding subunit YedZ
LTRFLRSTWFMALILAGCLIPLVMLGVDYFSSRLGPNPAQALEVRTGRIAISLLTASLAVSPLARLTKQAVFLRVRRPLGLATFFYVLFHLLLLVGLDYGFNLPLLVDSYLTKPFIWFGFLAGLILAILAITSFGRWRQKLGDRWERLHQLVYLAAILDLVHYFLVVKGNLISFSGNLGRPLFYGFLILSLLAFRLLKRDRPKVLQRVREDTPPVL